MQRAFLALTALGLSTVGSAADSFVGNTLKAVFEFTSQVCVINGECEPSETAQTILHAYFGTKGNVFDYGAFRNAGGAGGFLMRLNKPHLVKFKMNGYDVQVEQTWTVKGNVATFRMVAQGVGPKAVKATYATFTVSGGRCVANLSWIRPGVQHRASFTRRECSITPGQIEP